MSVAIVPVALQIAQVIPDSVGLNILVVIGALLNLPVLVPVGLFREAIPFTEHKWLSAFLPMMTLIFWRWLITLVKNRLTSDRPISIGV